VPRSSPLPPYQHRIVEAALAPIHLAELPATGPPLLLIHGIGMDWRVWQAIARRLHPYFHLYFLDLRGHGTSAKPESGYSLADYAADVEDVIDAIAMSGLTVAGSSLGGMVAAAIEVPADIVGHRILIDPPLTGGPVRDAAMLAEILRLKHRDPAELRAYLSELNPGVGAHYLTTMAQMWHSAADGVITEPLAHPGDYFAIDDQLRAIDAPTLILQADPERGGVLTDAQAERALKLLPRGEWIQVPGAGHAIHATNPFEFVREVRAFAGV
jgi:pimeloyl-ACP methyl ester carboxylesterase